MVRIAPCCKRQDQLGSRVSQAEIKRGTIGVGDLEQKTLAIDEPFLISPS